MRITTKGKRSPKTLKIPELRKTGMTIMQIAKKIKCTKQWVDYVLQRDGDPIPTNLLDTRVRPLDTVACKE